MDSVVEYDAVAATIAETESAQPEPEPPSATARPSRTPFPTIEPPTATRTRAPAQTAPAAQVVLDASRDENLFCAAFLAGTNTDNTIPFLQRGRRGRAPIRRCNCCGRW